MCLSTCLPLLVLLATGPAEAQSSASTDSGRARAAVMGVLDRLTRAMRTRDPALLRSAFEPGARLTGIRPRAGTTALQLLTVGQFADFLARDDRDACERFSHCGTDAFQLLETGDGWKIVALADTYRTDGCPKRSPPAATAAPLPVDRRPSTVDR